eukprot:gene9595-14898_t
MKGDRSGAAAGLAAVCVVMVLAIGMRSYRANRMAAAYIGEISEVRDMQGEISEQLLFLERNVSAVQELLDGLRRGGRAAGGDSDEEEDEDELTDEDLGRLEEKLAGKFSKIQAAFEERVQELAGLSATSLDTFKKLVNDNKGGQVRAGQSAWVVKWHQSGVNTSPKFDSESTAYQYYVSIGDFAKKLIAFDGTRWVLLKSYGGPQWTSLMTDDGTHQT